MARQFGSTWWGEAWVRSVEANISADAGRLSRGRTYARQGRVSVPEIIPGLVRAEVAGTEDYIADLSVVQLTNDAWQALIGVIASRTDNAAALLGGELPIALLDEAAEKGIELLPGSGEITPDCSCPDWGEPCKHAAALAYLVADAVDEDPFVLLLLRGRGRSELIDAIREVRAQSTRETSASSEARQSSEPSSSTPEISEANGVDADTAFARDLGPFPPPIEVPQRAGSPVALGTPPPIDSGLRLSELEYLASDAAIRATDLLHQCATSGLELSPEEDLARRAAQTRNHPAALSALAQASGHDLDDLARMGLAWGNGGVQGLRVSTTRWDPPVTKLESARVLLGPRARVFANVVTGNGIQLRVDQEGSWWRFRADDGLGWVLDSPGFADPAELL